MADFSNRYFFHVGLLLLFHCQEAIDSIGSCITRSLFTLYIFLEKTKTGVVQVIQHQHGIEQFIDLKSLEWARILTFVQVLELYIALSRITSFLSFLIWVSYVEISYGALNTIFVLCLLRGIVIMTIVLPQRSHSSFIDHFYHFYPRCKLYIWEWGVSFNFLIIPPRNVAWTLLP